MGMTNLASGFRMNVEVIEKAVPQNTLFVHGNLASNAWWKPCIDELLKGDFQGRRGKLVMVEWRGCGETKQLESEEQFSLDDIANDVCAVVDALDLGATHIVGHSLGGLISALAMAMEPQKFYKGVLLDPVGPQGTKLSPEILAAFETMKTDKALCEVIMASTIRDCDTSSALFAKIVADAQGVSPALWTAVPKRLDNIDYRSVLATVTNPVLVLHGEHDAVLTRSDAQALTALFQNGRYVELKGAGHSFNVERPAEFAEILTKALFS